MHQSFTGSARRSRQVNLSGRQTSNPWAASAKPTQTNASSTVAQAQADRLKRQQERERLAAARRIQKLWRGHTARRREKANWRHIWDENEARRCRSPNRLDYERLVDMTNDTAAYQNPADLLYQTRLLLHYQEFRRHRVRDEQDTLRLIFFGEALRQSIALLATARLDDVWRSTFSRLGIVVSRHLKSVLETKSAKTQAVQGPRLLQMITLLCQVVPDEMIQNADVLFDAIESAVLSQSGNLGPSCAEATVSLLTCTSPRIRSAYLAFARRMLSQNSFSNNKSLLDFLAEALDLNELSAAITAETEDLATDTTQSIDTSQLLWQLAHIIYFHDSLQKGYANQTNYIEAVSSLLGHSANEVAQRLDLADQPMFGNGNTTTEPLPEFVKDMIQRIPQQDNVRDVLLEMGTGMQSQASSQFDSAKRLANYAVALLRAFPSKAQNIRMSLYQGSVRSMGDTDVSTIQYFWQTTQATAVFKKVVQNHRSVLSILREAAPETDQLGQAPLSKEEISIWRDEWRIILLFFELYTFVLKFMDDDDFFAFDKSRIFSTADTPTSIVSRRGALPLGDVALMTTFLKNLAFTLYWNAADLVESDDSVEEANLSVLFGGAPVPSTRSTDRKEQTLTGNGVSQGYLKGLVTGLLRMLHERDSRRSFVPAGHWLMSDQINMAGFIPAVAAEEEKRHQLGDEEDFDDKEDSLDDAMEMDLSADSGSSETLLSAMFGIRPSHMPRSGASRQADRYERQRQQARKKRQLESLAPRLEILRNLPFFIPFETRVQIFREFIYQDQLRRRDGAIDPDQWRMSIATTTQGRGPDGRPRALDIISRHHAEIHRESVVEDAFNAFFQLGEGLKEPIQITFIDKFGTPEAGIDGGGVTKEFLMSVTSEALKPQDEFSMFSESPQHAIFPNPTLLSTLTEYLKQGGIRPGTDGEFETKIKETLPRMQFIGRVVGKCLYEGILIDVNFAGFFLLKWALTGGTTVGSNESAYRATINDLRDYDEELYHGLLKLKNYTGDVEADFSLDFTVTDMMHACDELGRVTPRPHTIELIPDGANTPVTNTNRLVYIDRIVRFRLQQQPKAITDAFLKGLGQIIQPMWLAMFNQKELQKLVGGDNTELDIADLRRNTHYGGVYAIGDDGLEHPTVQLFWKALQEMDDDDRRKVLKFVTSTPRAPLLGFSHLNPKFSIRDSSGDQERLPSTSTCVNLLKLPRYGDIQTMKEKLLYAVNSGAGFDLS
ncbi:ubiquitin-protein ligase (E3) [Rhinocladiella similis]